MSLIKSISGIRGTVGGFCGDNLTPIDIIKFTSSYSIWLKKHYSLTSGKVVVGRDARISGGIYSDLVCATLCSMGFDVTDIGLATTPTTEMAVTAEKADGGIIITASHNPKQWNALKLLNNKGEFLSAADGKELMAIAEKGEFEYAEVDKLGKITRKDYTDYHIDKVLALPLVDLKTIAASDLRIAVDAVNSVGGIIIPRLLERLGIKNIIRMNCEPTGDFAHNPEPIPANLTGISEVIRKEKADLGIVVDPDVDRLALVCEDGSMFIEEYTLVSVADYILSHTPGNTVSNLSSSRALRDVTAGYSGCSYSASAVGEVNVIEMMKKTGAVIGGEGNGGVIYPELHYGRDAIVGVALFLSLYTQQKKRMTELKKGYPQYCISKNRIDLKPEMDVEKVLEILKEQYSSNRITTIDGVKIDFESGWVHLRRSNTEPIIRVYSEARTEEEASALAQEVIDAFYANC